MLHERECFCLYSKKKYTKLGRENRKIFVMATLFFYSCISSSESCLSSSLEKKSSFALLACQRGTKNKIRRPEKKKILQVF